VGASPDTINSTLQGIVTNIGLEATNIAALSTAVVSTLAVGNASTIVALNAIAAAITAVFLPATGTFTLANATVTVVAQSQVQTNSVPLFVATNGTAALTLRTQGLYVSAKTAGVSFSVATQTGVALGSETLAYVVITP